MVVIVRKHTFKRNYYRWGLRLAHKPNDNLLFNKGDTVINFRYGGSSGYTNHFRSFEDALARIRGTFARHDVKDNDPDELLQRLLNDDLSEIRVYENGSVRLTEGSMDR